MTNLRRRSRRFCVASMVFALLLAGFPAGAAAQASAGGKALTVERIYGQPGLGGKLTRGLAWSPDGKTISFFESTAAGHREPMELWAMDAITGKKRVLVPAGKLESVLPEKTGPATQATGLGRHAPAQYEWAPDGSAILFVGPDSLAWFDLKTETARPLVNGKEAIADPKISPDGKFVSFVRDHNLYLVDVQSGKERSVTTGGTEQLRKGELDWVYPEELELTTAYWWAPDSSAIAYLEMDEREVNQYPLVDFASPAGAADEERYPVAGGKNPVVHVYTVPVDDGEPRLMDTGADTNIYLARVNWLRDSKHVAIQRLNRAQTELDLLVADASSGASHVLLTEKDAYWINVGNELYFLKDGKRFLWASERSGYRHLYLYGLDGKEIAQLTKGNWEVTALNAVDEARGLVYFTSTMESPTERQVYRVGLDGSGLARLTNEQGLHSANFAPDASAFFDTHSRAGVPPRQDLLRADGSELAPINENKVAELAEYHLSPVEFLKVKARDGAELNAYLIKPVGFDPAKKYPVLVYTYGGPHAQVVLDAWGGPTFLWHEMLAQKGFVIFALDNRGSAGRGHVFETPIYRHFGEKELADQHDGVAWLKSQPWVDAARIGVWGWSYGGHMTLHLMFEDAADFKAGFAGGPVTDWHYYDSIYTERYMGLPQENEENYKKSSPITHADGLKGKLLIAHGTGDDNVHFANTLTLINRLIEKGKYVEVMPFPGRGHGVSDAPARIVLMKRVTKFFLDNLGTH
jgi:dipeptidyl-peptidase-4